jgi:hypothetical protein
MPRPMTHLGLAVLAATALAAAPAAGASADRARTPGEGRTAPADTTGPVYRGDERQTEVTVPLVDAAVKVDGSLDEPVWARAALLTGFTRYLPQDGPPAEDSTEVLLWYSAEALYVGIRAFEVHGPVGASRSSRDRIGNDDRVRILLDTYHDARRAFAFGVNAFGVQEDGMRLEGQKTTADLFAADRSVDPADLTPDFLYDSQGRLIEDGYEVEMRIPFSSLRFSSGQDQVWGLNVVRRVPHSGRELTWAPVRQGKTSFLAQEGTLRGLRGLRRGANLDINPVATARADGAPGAGGWRYDASRPSFGANLRYGVTSDLNLNATVNPDFSQVEADAEQLSYDPRQALYYAEKRPFFLTGSEHFAAPSNLIYTRRIDNPDVAAKLSGTIHGVSAGVLTALNAPDPGDTGESLFDIARLQGNVGSESTVGLLYTSRIHRSDYNHVVGADTRLVLGKSYVLSAQGAASWSGDSASSAWGPLWLVSLERSGRVFGATATFWGRDPDFRTDAGFLTRTGIVHAGFQPRVTLFGSPDAALASVTNSISLYGDWLYEDLFGGRGPESLKIHFSSDAAFRSGWQAGASVLLERFYYPPYLYADYAILRPTSTGTDTVPFTGTPSLANLDFVVRLATPKWDRFDANLTLIFGRDENFFEWAPADVLIIQGALNWKPTDRLHFEATYARQQYMRPDDRSNVGIRDIPRLKTTYQLSRAIYVRLIGQYDANYRDALRDDTRTGDPILLRDPVTGTFLRTTALRSGSLHADGLFAIQPGPGTVLFVGYGTNLQEPSRFGFGSLSRSDDAFFIKLSYLLRM